MPSSGVQTCARSEEHTSELQHGSISYAVSLDRKSTRLNSSHGSISYAVFCLKKKITAPRTAIHRPAPHPQTCAPRLQTNAGHAGPRSRLGWRPYDRLVVLAGFFFF